MKRRDILQGAAALFVAGIFSFAGGSSVSAEDGVAVNATNFPDNNFRKVASEYDKNSDGKLSASELSQVTNISSPNCNITSIKGIEYFTEITELDCSYNSITEMDVSKNKKLVNLRADNNKLTKPDISALTELEEVNFGGFTVETVDLSNNKKLKWAALGANIKTLDVSNNTELESLNVGGTYSELNLSNNKKLQYIYLGKANLKILDISKCTSLVSVDITSCHSIDLVIIPKDAILVDKYDGVNLHIDHWRNETIIRDEDEYTNMWIDGKWYGADGSQTYDGLMSWKQDDKGWWIEDTYGWYPVSCWQMIDFRWYYFDSSGYMSANEYREGYYLSSSGALADKHLYYWIWEDNGWKYKYDASGSGYSGYYLKSSWAKIDGSWYYFDDNNFMVTDQYVDGYWIGSDGVCW